MFKKTINYVDYNGEKRSGIYYFHLNKADIVELQMGVKGGLMEKLQEAIRTDDAPFIMDTFRKIIRKSYGEKSIDGKSFVKFKIVDGARVELADLFEQTPAYSELFVELLTDDNAADEFMRNVIPAEMAGQLPADIKEALPEELAEMLPTQN